MKPAEAFHVKLEGIGYGFLIPIFFIATGIEFNLDALLRARLRARARSGVRALFLVARGPPAGPLYRHEHARARADGARAASASATLPLVATIPR